VPSLPARAGNLAAQTVKVDPAAAKYLGFYPLPNGPLVGNGDRAIFTFAGQQVVNENFFTLRGDEKFSENDSVFATYEFDDASFTSPDKFDNVLLGSRTKRQIAVLEEDHTFGSRFLNSLRLGYNRDRVDNDQGVKAINPLASDPLIHPWPRCLENSRRTSPYPAFRSSQGVSEEHRSPFSDGIHIKYMTMLRSPGDFIR
jgi:hypothetical protein